MRAWIVITLMAFVSTLTSSPGHCEECVDHGSTMSRISATDLMKSSGDAGKQLTIVNVENHALTKQSHSNSKSQTPIQHECFCNHVHCCGMVLSENLFHPLHDLSKIPPIADSFIESVKLDLSIKPPSA